MNFEKLIAARKSERIYSGETIPSEFIERLMEAAYLAPSSRALFPVEFIVVKDHGILRKLSRVKTAGSGMLKNADAAIVVLGDREKSDAWIEDCSIAMIYMQLMATELGVANCWVQCRNRKSQQLKGIAISDEEDSSEAESEAQVAAQIAAVKDSNDYLTAEEYARELLHFPKRMALEAILSLGMPVSEGNDKKRTCPSGKTYFGQYGCEKE